MHFVAGLIAAFGHMHEELFIAAVDRRLDHLGRDVI